MPAPALDQDLIINVQSMELIIITIIVITTNCVLTSFLVRIIDGCFMAHFYFMFKNYYYLLFSFKKGDEVDVEMCDESTMMMVIPNGHHHHHYHHDS